MIVHHIYMFYIPKYESIPSWFKEGMAMHYSKEFSLVHKIEISHSSWKNQLIPLSKLNNIEYVVDSAKFKQGRFTPVLHLKIVPPEYLLQESVDLIIVMVPGLYPDEVLKTIKKMKVEAEVAVLRNNKIEFII